MQPTSRNGTLKHKLYCLSCVQPWQPLPCGDSGIGFYYIIFGEIQEMRSAPFLPWNS